MVRLTVRVREGGQPLVEDLVAEGDRFSPHAGLVLTAAHRGGVEDANGA